jgi:hypothetical protein
MLEIKIGFVAAIVCKFTQYCYVIWYLTRMSQNNYGNSRCDVISRYVIICQASGACGCSNCGWHMGQSAPCAAVLDSERIPGQRQRLRPPQYTLRYYRRWRSLVCGGEVARRFQLHVTCVHVTHFMYISFSSLFRSHHPIQFLPRNIGSLSTFFFSIA